MLKYRILTALVLIPLVLAGIFYLSELWFACVSAVVVLMGGWEWAGLMGWTSLIRRSIYLLWLLLLLLILLVLPASVVLGVATVIWLAMLYFVFRYDQFTTAWTSLPWIRGSLGLCILGSTWFALNFIHQVPKLGPYYLLFLLLFIWGADTGAYFVGKQWGKNKLAPAISPGKSIEGVLGGSAVSVTLAIIIGWFFYPQHDPADYVGFILLALVISLVSVLGDLSESMIKRQAGVKDSGNLLPGHGGLLDRIDSLLCAAPFFALGMIVLW